MPSEQTRPPVYICAPYSAETPEEIALNVQRAEALGRLASLMGFAPIVVHSQIAGVYGTGDLDDDPEARALGMACDLATLDLVASHPHGRLWVLLTDDRDHTDSMATENDRWHTHRLDGVREHTWKEWGALAKEVGLPPAWWAQLDLGAVVEAHFACNHPSTGRFTESVSMVELVFGDHHLTLDGRLVRMAWHTNDRVQVGDVVLARDGHQHHTGNWCWDATRMGLADSRRLVTELRKHGWQESSSTIGGPWDSLLGVA